MSISCLKFKVFVDTVSLKIILPVASVNLIPTFEVFSYKKDTNHIERLNCTIRYICSNSEILVEKFV